MCQITIIYFYNKIKRKLYKNLIKEDFLEMVFFRHKQVQYIHNTEQYIHKQIIIFVLLLHITQINWVDFMRASTENNKILHLPMPHAE